MRVPFCDGKEKLIHNNKQIKTLEGINLILMLYLSVGLTLKNESGSHMFTKTSDQTTFPVLTPFMVNNLGLKR